MVAPEESPLALIEVEPGAGGHEEGRPIAVFFELP
jgi:hypothetical protein